MNISFKKVFETFFQTFSSEKIVLIDNNAFEIIKNIFTKQDLINNKILDVLQISSNLDKHKICPFIIILSSENILNQYYDKISTIKSKNIFILNDIFNNFSQFKTSAKISLDFKVVLPNFITNINTINIKYILSNANEIIINKIMNVDVVSNISTNNYIIQIKNDDNIIKYLHHWSYFSLLYKYNILTTEFIEMSKSDPYFNDLWNKKYEEVMNFVKDEMIRLDKINVKSINYNEIQIMKKYINLHYKFITELEKKLNENNIFEKSLNENKALIRQIKQNDFNKLYNNIELTKMLYEYPKIILNQEISEYYIYSKRKHSLVNKLKNIIYENNITNVNKIFVLIDNITIEEVIEINKYLDYDITILSQQDYCEPIYMSYVKDKYMNYNFKFKINFLAKEKIENMKIMFYDYIDKYIDKFIELKKNIFNTDNDDEILSLELTITNSIKNEFNKLGDKNNLENRLKIKELENLTFKYKNFKDKNTKYFTNDLKPNNYEITENNPTQYLLDEYDNGLENYLMEIEERSRDIEQIHKNIIELNELFLDINLLLQNQGQVLDTIEAHIENASSNIESGVEQLQKAENYQKKASSKLNYLAGVIGGVAAVVGLSVGLKFK
jgi:t-SNARE complex subunit (syntaxin)